MANPVIVQILGATAQEAKTTHSQILDEHGAETSLDKHLSEATGGSAGARQNWESFLRAEPVQPQS